MKTSLYAADVSALEDEDVYRMYYSSLPEFRKAKADRMAFPEGRRLSVGVWSLLRMALAEQGIDDSRLAFETGEFGKPYCRGGGVRFSLSHSEKTVLCLVSEKECGCDVELVKNHDLRIAERHFAREEYECIMAFEGDEARAAMFARFWTLKESFMKCTGLGFRLGTGEFCIVPGERISVRQSVDGAGYSFYEYSIPGYAAAACLRNAGDEEPPVLKLASFG